jgi:uncharacterized protein YecE (DUF72 family)
MIWIGTSGFQYPEWKGTFYPDKMSPPKMLEYYAAHFPTTEINYTFRRLPSEKSIANWLAQTPAQFRFTLKAPEQITHHRRLKECEPSLHAFAAVAAKLKPKLGALLFQLPPKFECDTAVLDDFLAAVPPGLTAAFEFRHESWFIPSMYETLRRHQATLCIADTDELKTPKLFTGPAGYFRLRRVNYTPAELKEWAAIIREQATKLTDIYVYLRHEESGTGPRLGKQLMELLGLKSGGASAPELPLT